MEERKQYSKDYYLRNKDNYTEKYWCGVCSGIFTMPNRSNHFKTEKHIKGEFYEALENKLEEHQLQLGLVCHSRCHFFGLPLLKRSVIVLQSTAERFV